MKRVELLKIIEGFGCVLIRHGAKHDWYRNPNTGVSNQCRVIAKSRNIFRDVLSACWATTKAAADEPERSWLAIKVRTWHTFEQESGLIRSLTHAESRSRKAKLDALGGMCDVRGGWHALKLGDGRGCVSYCGLVSYGCGSPIRA